MDKEKKRKKEKHQDGSGDGKEEEGGGQKEASVKEERNKQGYLVPASVLTPNTLTYHTIRFECADKGNFEPSLRFKALETLKGLYTKEVPSHLASCMEGRELIEIIRAKDPIVVFLAETLTDDARLEFAQTRLNLQAIKLHQVAEQAKEMLVQFCANQQVPEVQIMNSGNGGSRWRYLQAGLVKINFDGVVFSESHMSGIGVLIRVDKGAILASCSEKIHQAYKADVIEVLVAMKAVSFALELGS
uniref:Uncharacterized protein n=1 Tax=Quercus lobata TaxID=97700 RepID=A0A7N2R3V7_QUELO